MATSSYTPVNFNSSMFADPRKLELGLGRPQLPQPKPGGFTPPPMTPMQSPDEMTQQPAPESTGGNGLGSMVSGLRDIAHEQQQTGLQKQREFLQPGRHLDMSGNDTNANPGGSASIQAGWGWDKPATPAPHSWDPAYTGHGTSQGDVGSVINNGSNGIPGQTQTASGTLVDPQLAHNTVQNTDPQGLLGGSPQGISAASWGNTPHAVAGKRLVGPPAPNAKLGSSFGFSS